MAATFPAEVVLGQGNVALDVARLLVRPPRDLDATDMERAAVNQWLRCTAMLLSKGSLLVATTKKQPEATINKLEHQ